MKNASTVKMSASNTQGCEKVSFKITSSMPMTQLNEKFQDNEFRTVGFNLSRKSKTPRSKTISMALPMGAEGKWGTIDKDIYKSPYFQYLEFDRNYVIAGNWKSNEDWCFINSFPDENNEVSFDNQKIEVIGASSNAYLSNIKDLLDGGQVQPMAQDISEQDAVHLSNEGVKWTLTGHSSQRKYLKDQSYEEIALKTKAALDNGMNVMLCIGETIDEKEAFTTGKVCAR